MSCLGQDEVGCTPGGFSDQGFRADLERQREHLAPAPLAVNGSCDRPGSRGTSPSPAPGQTLLPAL